MPCVHDKHFARHILLQEQIFFILKHHGITAHIVNIQHDSPDIQT